MPVEASSASAAHAGNVYKDSGMLKEAEAMYATALRLKPDHAIVIGNLAAVQLELGRVRLRHRHRRVGAMLHALA